MAAPRGPRRGRGGATPSRRTPHRGRGLALVVAALLFVSAALAAVGGPARVPWLWKRTFVQPTDPPPLAADRNDCWRQDLAYLAENLVRLHGDAFHTVPRERFDAAVAEAVRRVPERSDAELVVATMRIVASIGDGHTTTWSWLATFRPYPVGFARVGGDWVVVEVVDGHQALLGAELIDVGGTPVDEAVRRVTPRTASESDADRDARVARLLGYGEILHAVALQPAPDVGTFTLRTRDGARRTVALAVVDPGAPRVRADFELPLHLEPEADHAWTWLEEAGAVYLRFRRCADANGFATRAEAILARLERDPGARLIVDLRRNGGGDSTVMRPLLRGLRRLDAGDRTYVLPASGLRIQVSNYRFRGDDRPLEPDLPVVPTVDAWLEGRDPVFETVLGSTAGACR